ncbi:MAG: 3,4-dihydroxy-2-butanone-4-phosphate synthase [Haloferacaceae archaeon]
MRESRLDREAVARAVAALRTGDPVLVHDFDDREGETDLVYPAGAVTPEAVARMRNDAGGLVCVALADRVAAALDLPYREDTVDHPAADGRPAYDDRSSFSLTVNHRETYTGITDDDRALTITELAEVARAVDAGEGYGPEAFAASFRVPGHVHVLRGAPALLGDRRGHTELALALADEAGLPPAVVVCEMLDDATGRALARDDAAAYAERHGLAFVDGDRVVAALAD